MRPLLILIIITSILSSCSTSRTFNSGVFQKRKYNSGFYFNSKKNIQKKNNVETVAPEKIINEAKQKINESAFILTKSEVITEPELANIVSDSVKIVLKNGDTYSGIKTEETKNGYVIILEGGRSIYLLKNSVAEMVILKSSKEEESKKTEETIISNESSDDYAISTSSSSPQNKKKKILPDESKIGLTMASLGFLAMCTLLFLLFFEVWLSAAIVLGILIPAVLLPIIGWVFSAKGYKKAMENSKIFDADKADVVNDLVKGFALVFITPLAISIAFAIIGLIIMLLVFLLI